MTIRAAMTLTGVLLHLTIAGCTAPDEDAGPGPQAPVEPDSWIGALDREIVLEWGAPDATYQMQDGTRILTWRRSRTERKGGEIYTIAETRTVGGKTVVIPVTHQTPIVTSRYECVTSVEVDADGYVVGFTAEGNDCAEQPTPD